MTREEIVEHFAAVVSAVFYAEDQLRPQWAERLRACKRLSEKEKQKVCDGYLKAIAEEMIHQYSTEELERIYSNDPNPCSWPLGPETDNSLHGEKE